MDVLSKLDPYISLYPQAYANERAISLLWEPRTTVCAVRVNDVAAEERKDKSLRCLV